MSVFTAQHAAYVFEVYDHQKLLKKSRKSHFLAHETMEEAAISHNLGLDEIKDDLLNRLFLQ